MLLIRDIGEIPDNLRGGAVTIGNFDGVHRGHARILGELREAARFVGGPSIVFTFDPHPVRVLRPEAAPPPLTWTERKADLLGRAGVEVVVAYPTDRRLLSYSPGAFFATIIHEKLGARAIVEGANFHFGRGRTGNVARLRHLCDAAGIHLRVVDTALADGAVVSSSRIRGLVQAGQVGAARELLTEPLRIRGRVVPGARRGATLGFPTANLGQIDTLLPGFGVYGGRAYCDQQRYPAAIHIGPNLTFSECTVKVEVHILDFPSDRNLYDRWLEVDFVERLREVRTFSTVCELQAQLTRDVAAARAVAGG